MEMEEKKLETNTEQNLPVRSCPPISPPRCVRSWLRI